MTDIVTGGAGFIGFHLASRLQREGRDVVLVDNFIRGERDYRLLELLKNKNVRLIEGDLCDAPFVDSLPDAQRVFHFAAYNGTQNFYQNPVGVLRHSTIPALNLVERYMARQKVELFAYTGSSESYAGAIKWGITGIPTPETTPLVIDDITNSRWSYATGKLHGEVTTAVAGDHHGVPWQVWRVHNCFGPRMGAKHVIPDFTERAVRGVYELYGADDTRTFLYVDDAVDLMMRLSQSDLAARQIVNVGGINEMSMLELGNAVLGAMGIAGEIVVHAAPSGSTPRRRPDVTKLQELAGKLEFTEFTQALKVTVDSIVDDINQGVYGEK